MSRLFLLLVVSPFFCNSQILFEESATSIGVGYSYGLSYYGGGVSFCDFDDDGWDDITFATENDKEVLFFKNMGGEFTQIDLGINHTYETKQVLWVDYDNDGDMDFFATSVAGLNKLYNNDGNMSFTDVSENCGLFRKDLYTFGASFGDIDNDGDLDVFISNRDILSKNQRNYLYRNDDGFFTDISAASGISSENDLSFCASFFDYDNDGFQDIYVANDKKVKYNRLYRNKGNNTFEDVSFSSGAGIYIDAMSTTIDDYNNDGWFDIYVTNTFEGNYHLRNNGDGTFTNVAAELGTAFYSVAWGAVYLDADNDADQDLYVSGMFDGSFGGHLPSAFYENVDGNFTIPTEIGFENDTRASFSNAIGDADNDGFPEIVVMNDSLNNFLWKNKTVNTNKWLKVKLQGTQSNKSGIGSKIEVFANGKSQYRYTLCGEGYLSQNSNNEFFGLRDATNIDYVKVTWLSGIVDLLTDIDPNQVLTIVEGSAAINGGEDETEDNGDEDESEDTSDSDDLVSDSNPIEDNNDTNETLVCDEKDLLYPNPISSGYLRFCPDFISQNHTAKVYDMLGNQLIDQTINVEELSLNLTDLSRGVYIIKLISDKGDTTVRKVLKL